MLTIRELTEMELAAAAIIDGEVNLSPWQLINYQEAWNNPQQQLWGAFNQAAELLACAVFSLISDQAEILQLATKLSAQRQGYARLLLKQIIWLASEDTVSEIFLEVRTTNQAAIKLYQAQGFNQIGLRKNYYLIDNQRYDALIMVKTLCHA